MHLISASQAFIILRIVTAFVAFLAFLLLCILEEGMPLRTAALGGGALAYSLVFTFNNPWEHPSDFPDVMFFSVFLFLARRKRRWIFLATALLATLNHQTAAFAGVIWFCMWGIESRFQPKWAEAFYATGLVLSSYGLSTAVKDLWFGNYKPVDYDGQLTVSHFIEALRHPGPFVWPVLLVAMLLPTSLWLWSNRDVVQDDICRLIWASIAIFVLSTPLVYLSELRSAFLAPIVVATFAATVAEFRMQQKATERILDSAAAKVIS